MTETSQLFLFADVVPLGGGSFKVVPQRPQAEVTPRQAARFLSISRPSVYRLLESGLIQCRRPTPGKILISTDALRAHREACADPEFWSKTRNPSQALLFSQAS